MKHISKLIDGSPESWDDIWKNKLTFNFKRTCLFTRSRTKTIYEFWQRAYANDLLSIIDNKNYYDFIELGAGRGTTSMYLSDAGYHKITLVDLSEEAKRITAINFNQFDLSFKDFITADVRNTGLPTGSFDCVYNIGLLEHFNNPAAVLNEAYRLLRTGGMIFMPVFPDRVAPFSYVLRFLLNPLSYIKKIFGNANRKDDQMTRTTALPAEYVDICIQSGFQKAECLYYNPYPKIVRDGWYENNVVLNVYKLIHFLRKKYNKKLEYQTSTFFGSGYLLIAYK